MKTIAIETIQTPVEAVWATISQGGGVHRWFPEVIKTCDLKGVGEGAARHCTMSDGSELEERILEIDHKARRFRYAIDKHPLPASDVVSTIEVVELRSGETRITWGADYTVSIENAEHVHDTLQGLYRQGILALQSHHEQPAKEAI